MIETAYTETDLESAAPIAPVAMAHMTRARADAVHRPLARRGSRRGGRREEGRPAARGGTGGTAAGVVSPRSRRGAIGAEHDARWRAVMPEPVRRLRAATRRDPVL